MKIRRINIAAGPGSGKSTLNSWLSAEITIAGYDVQIVDEYVKSWAVNGKVPASWDQCYLWAKQMYKEDTYLRSDKHIVITDCPLLMVGAYALQGNHPFAEELISMTKKFDKRYPACYLFLDRNDIPYRTEGRYETYAQALEMDRLIEKVMQDHLPSYLKVKTKDRQQILSQLLEMLKN